MKLPYKIILADIYPREMKIMFTLHLCVSVYGGFIYKSPKLKAARHLSVGEQLEWGTYTHGILFSSQNERIIDTCNKLGGSPGDYPG